MKKTQKHHYISNPEFYASLVEYSKLCKIKKHEYLEKYESDIEFDSRGRIKKSDTIPPLEYPRIPEDIGKALYLICNKLAGMPSFYGYSFKDELISDAYYDCILRINSFSPEKTNFTVTDKQNPDEKKRFFYDVSDVCSFILEIDSSFETEKLKQFYTENMYTYSSDFDSERFSVKLTKNPFAYFTQLAYFAYVRRIKTEKKQSVIKEELIRNSSSLDSLLSEKQHLDDGSYDSSYMSFLQETVDVIKTDAEKSSDDRKLIKKTTRKHQVKLKALDAEKQLDDQRTKWEDELFRKEDVYEEENSSQLNEFMDLYYEEHDLKD